MTKITIHGYPSGWWNETTILYKSDGHDLALYDILKDQSSVLLPADKIKEFLQQNQLSDDPTDNQVAPIPMWDYERNASERHWDALTTLLRERLPATTG
jgi:hypothetical protein